MTETVIFHVSLQEYKLCSMICVIQQPAFKTLLCLWFNFVVLLELLPSVVRRKATLHKNQGLREVHAQKPSFSVFKMSLELPLFNVALY